MLSVNKMRTVILRRAAKLSAVLDMFPDEGNVIIGFSGGADSMVLTDILFEMSNRWQRKISFLPVMIDQGYFQIAGDDRTQLSQFCQRRNMELVIVEQHDIAEKTKSDRNPFPACFTCSRMRRKVLFETAQKLDAKVIALGHHKNDLLETFLLNILFSRRISAIMPKQEFFGGLFHIIRPLLLVDEDYIKRYAALRAFPAIKKSCPYESNTQRKWVKNLLARMENSRPGIKSNIVRAIFHPKPEYLWGKYEHIIDKLLK